MIIHEDFESVEERDAGGCKSGAPATNWIPGCLYLMVRDGADLKRVSSSSSGVSYTVEMMTSRVALRRRFFVCGMCLTSFSPRYLSSREPDIPRQKLWLVFHKF